MKRKRVFRFFILTIGVVVANTMSQTNIDQAIFAGGCFWCMKSPFEKLDGIQDVIAGYIGGTKANPTYQDYAQNGHVEAVQITYDPKRVSYTTLLDIFWRQIDPTDARGQFVDRGPQYRTAIFYLTDEQKKLAEESKKQLDQSGRFSKPIVTELIKASPFYKAEEYHQDYHTKNSWRYWWYRYNSGRDRFLKKVWGKQIKKNNKGANAHYKKQSEQELRNQLTPLQYYVTQQNGTEKPFANEYWDNKSPGIYVDVVSEEPLFSSLDKFKSGTGWPSFTKPLEPDNIIEREDKRLLKTRIEVRSKHGDSHLGHLLHDGPRPTGLRYCINSAALRFILLDDLEKKGYGQYKKLFK